MFAGVCIPLRCLYVAAVLQRFSRMQSRPDDRLVNYDREYPVFATQMQTGMCGQADQPYLHVSPAAIALRCMDDCGHAQSQAKRSPVRSSSFTRRARPRRCARRCAGHCRGDTQTTSVSNTILTARPSSPHGVMFVIWSTREPSGRSESLIRQPQSGLSGT